MGFLFSSKKEKLIAVFDIGSGSVGGSLVRIPTDQKELPTIINSTRVEIVERDDVKFDRFLKDMILALGFASCSGSTLVSTIGFSYSIFKLRAYWPIGLTTPNLFPLLSTTVVVLDIRVGLLYSTSFL